MSRTAQQLRLAAALRAHGFGQRDVTCRTEIQRIRDRERGFTYSQYGEAIATSRHTAVAGRLNDIREELVADGLNVTVICRSGNVPAIVVVTEAVGSTGHLKVMDDAYYAEQRAVLAQADEILGAETR